MLKRDAIAHWNASYAQLLGTFGVKIIGIEEQELKPGLRPEGQAELLLSERVSLAAALPALALALRGRGDLLAVDPAERKARKDEVKQAADRIASAAELEVFYSQVMENPKVAFLVRVGEGGGEAGRRKPGEGLNASLFPGQLIVNPQHAGKSIEELEAAGVKVYRIATDPVEGTTKTVMCEPSGLVAILVVDGEIAQVPDIYMEKLTVDERAAKSGLDTDETLEKIVQGLADSHRVTPNGLNGFALDRPRHPIKTMRDLGLNVVLDSDGDLLPGIAPGAVPGVYENGLPIHAMVGDIGGAAEHMIAATANAWLGGASHGKFVSPKGMKARNWDGRYDYNDEDRTVVESAGFKLGKNYPIGQLVDLRDGIAVFGGITDHAHFPQLMGVRIGANYAQVDVLKVGASGRYTVRRFTFEFQAEREIMVENFSPVSETLMHCDLADIRGELRKIIENPQRAERLHREIGLSFYQVFDVQEGKFKVNSEKLEQLGDDRTRAIIQNLSALKPDWFQDFKPFLMVF